jgi:polysaccharide deacetylase family protein (PEP-CTERM system associated)
MSVDVEDYFQVEAFSDCVSRSSWDSWPSRVVDNTKRCLDLLDRHETKATFFLVGWVADKFPRLPLEIAARGHELGCHSYWHRTIFSLTPAQFREDLRQSRDVIEQSGGSRVLGFRAPSWSITRDSLWALDILAEEGFLYDSSIFPIAHDIYGVPDAPRTPYSHTCASGVRLAEFPPATISLFGWNLPAAGGGYLRLLPAWYHHLAFRAAEREGHPLVVYFHPWELDPEQPRIKAKLRSRFRHYTNISRMEGRLAALMSRYRFRSFRDLLNLESVSAEPGGSVRR